MVSLEQARVVILAGVRPASSVETLALAHADGRFLATDVSARVDHPAFDNSAMDGYALRLADLAAYGYKLPVIGESRCGDGRATLAAASAMRIFTGAPLPDDADTVVIQEEVKHEGARAIFPASLHAGDHIRRRGEDFHAGELLYRRGRRLRPYDLALLATAGISEIEAFQPPRALVLATGDELASPGDALTPGQVYESNRLAITLQLRALGAIVQDGGIVPDDVQALRRALEGAPNYDFVITSGGASVGDYDLVRQAFAEFGEINLWKVGIKPGKPLAFGRIGRRTHFFALPGNPVSSLVTYKLLVEPALIVWNHGEPSMPELAATAANRFRRVPGRTEFLRGRIYTERGALRARVLPGQGSHMLGPLRETNAFITVEADSDGFDEGERVSVIPLTLEFC